MPGTRPKAELIEFFQLFDPTAYSHAELANAYDALTGAVTAAPSGSIAGEVETVRVGLTVSSDEAPEALARIATYVAALEKALDATLLGWDRALEQARADLAQSNGDQQ